MKDLYKILGISRNASAKEIKAAYKRCALKFHPDKGGTVEQMQQVTEAYSTLSDEDKRHIYDIRWSVVSDSNEEISEDRKALEQGDYVPYSHAFKKEHQALIREYSKKKLEPGDVSAYFQPLVSLYTADRRQFSSFYQAIHERTNRQVYPAAEADVVPQEPLTPTLAITLFTQFLSGEFDINALELIQAYMQEEMIQLKLDNPLACELPFYEGISELFTHTLSPDSAQAETQLFSVKKIIDFVQVSPDALFQNIVSLFYNPLFRHLCLSAIQEYWLSSQTLFTVEQLGLFDGQATAKELFELLADRMSRTNQKDETYQYIRYIKLLYNLDKAIDHRHPVAQAKHYRDSAFLLLDWIPALLEQTPRKVLINIFLQIGIKFQQASRHKSRPEIRIADEKLALKMYMTCYSLGHEHASPDIELYTNIEILRYLAAFRFKHSLLEDFIPAVQKRTLMLFDFFPVFNGTLSNIRLLEENKSLPFMRRLLQTMVSALEHNKTHNQSIELNRTPASILYHAYEACLKNWYQDEPDLLLEQKFRLDLMDELLFEQGWTFFDVEPLMNAPWVMMRRDPDGWMDLSRSLPFAQEDTTPKYSAINGVEMNPKTGDIQFFLTPWPEYRPASEKLFSLYDLQQLLENELDSAIFSLDPVDPDMPFHPFNQMRFAPAKLQGSALLHTMFLTDYLLKFLTTNQEVQGEYPFEQRDVAHLIKHLPQYLRQIIYDYHEASGVGALNRFWIEAETIDYAVTGERSDEPFTLELGRMRMVVKKHRMKYDVHGKLQDEGDEQEGWPIYVLTAAQMQELATGKRTLSGHAMIFIHAQFKLYYWEDNKVLQFHTPENYRESLIRLFKQPRSPQGQILVSKENERLLYRATKDMAKQSGQPHRYSPEFIFAHEFTNHYDEFAQYLPEFGRLKELSKITVVVRTLAGIRAQNKESLEALNAYMKQPLQPLQTETYQFYQQQFNALQSKLTTLFQEIRKEHSLWALKETWRTQLRSIKAEIGDLNLTANSPEVQKACQNWHDQIKRTHDYESTRIWREVIEPKRADIVLQLNTAKRKNAYSELYTLFQSRLSHLSTERYSQIINSFLDGSTEPLAEALYQSEAITRWEHLLPQLQKQFIGATPASLRQALNDEDERGMEEIIRQELYRQIREVMVPMERKEEGFKRIQFGIAKESKEVNEECVWVPATARHEVKRDERSGHVRQSFFVYGGVSVQPRGNRIPPTGGRLGGSAVGGTFNRANITRGFEKHHIISPTNQATKNHELLERAGFNNKKDMNSRVNLIYLPNEKKGGYHPNRAQHNGRHTQHAMNQVANEMKRVVEAGKAQNWTPSQYRAALRKVIADLRQDLRQGKTDLYVNPKNKK